MTIFWIVLTAVFAFSGGVCLMSWADESNRKRKWASRMEIRQMGQAASELADACEDAMARMDSLANSYRARGQRDRHQGHGPR